MCVCDDLVLCVRVCVWVGVLHTSICSSTFLLAILLKEPNKKKKKLMFETKQQYSVLGVRVCVCN